MPNVGLNQGEKPALLEEDVLPFFEVAEVQEEIMGVCRDPEDDKIISCGLVNGLVLPGAVDSLTVNEVGL